MEESSHYHEIFNDLILKGFNLREPLIWGFFFFSNNKKKLQQVVNELSGSNYKIQISKLDNKEYKLIAEKSEVLTPDKLNKRNIAFAELANYCDVLFDGWEVSK